MNYSNELNLIFSLKKNLKHQLILKFFFDFNILRASLSKPLAIITSKKILLISEANFFLILKLQETIPPKALIGSHAKADL